MKNRNVITKYVSNKERILNDKVNYELVAYHGMNPRGRHYTEMKIIHFFGISYGIYFLVNGNVLLNIIGTNNTAIGSKEFDNSDNSINNDNLISFIIRGSEEIIKDLNISPS